MESGVQDAENPDEWKDEIRNEVMAETVEEEGSDGDQSQETESNLWDQAKRRRRPPTEAPEWAGIWGRSTQRLSGRRR